MNQCKQMRSQIVFYLDDELQDGDRAALETHLVACEACREIFDGEQRFVETIRDTRPLHTATPELLARVENILNDAPSLHIASPALRQRVQRSLWQFGSTSTGHLNTYRIIAVLITLAAALIITIWSVNRYKTGRPKRPSDFAVKAVETHGRHLRGQLPLEIESDEPQKVSEWFVDKVPFSVELPNYQEISGQEKIYKLEGGRLVEFNNEYAAYVAYQMQKRDISLLVTSDTVFQPSGGEEIVSKGITFHYDSISGLKVITWSDRGLTYALVSDLEERGQQSCIVCHQGTKDQDFIESLRPK